MEKNLKQIILLNLVFCVLTASLAGASFSDFPNNGHGISTSVKEAPYVNILDVEITHNVKVDGKWGLRIDVDFHAFYLKNTTCELGAYFYFDSEERLKDFNTRYATKDHQVFTCEMFRPNYTEANYTNYSLYIPYSELHIDNNELYNLELVVAAKSGEIHLGWSKYIPFSVRLD